MQNYEFLDQLQKIIHQRATSGDEKSYIKTLFDRGLDKVAQKVGEEAVEVVIASKNEDEKEFIYESADLLFHYLLLLEKKGVSLQKILEELESRQK